MAPSLGKINLFAAVGGDELPRKAAAEVASVCGDCAAAGDAVGDGDIMPISAVPGPPHFFQPASRRPQQLNQHPASRCPCLRESAKGNARKDQRARNPGSAEIVLLNFELFRASDMISRTSKFAMMSGGSAQTSRFPPPSRRLNLIGTGLR